MTDSTTGAESAEAGDAGGRVPPAAVAAIPVAVALVVALVQLIAAHTTVLTPWKGGGFGMFSTVDSDVQRVVTLHLEVDDQWVPAVVPERYEQDVRSLRPMPTETRTERLADRLADRQWAQTPGFVPAELHELMYDDQPVVDRFFELRTDRHDDKAVVDVDRVRLRVYRKTWAPASDRPGGEVGLEPIEAAVVSAGADSDNSTGSR